MCLLNQHIENAHNKSFPCLVCKDILDSEVSLELHKTSHVRNAAEDALNICQICDKKINTTELSTICDHCEFSFHKRCTDLKSKSSGHWRPNIWKCEFCLRTNPDIVILEPAVPSEESTEGQINAPPTGNRTKLPNLTGRQRKSNIEVNNPQLEFLKAQLTSLKVALAQKDAEMKKVLESDKLKAQKIIALNAELQEQGNFITKQCNVTPSTEVPDTISQSTYGTENTRVNFLELKTSSLEQQVTMLMTKMDSFQINLLPSPSCNSKKCETCEDKPSLLYKSM